MAATNLSNRPDDLIVSLSRHFDAPRELVFRAFTEPKHLAHFWGPDGFTAKVLEMDLRRGGAFRIEMRGPDGVLYPCEGLYREIVAPERIVYLGGPDCGHPCGGGLPPQALVTMTFAENGGKTRLTVETRFLSTASREAAVEAGFNAGWPQCLDRLAKLLDQARSGA